MTERRRLAEIHADEVYQNQCIGIRITLDNGIRFGEVIAAGDIADEVKAATTQMAEKQPGLYQYRGPVSEDGDSHGFMIGAE